MRYMPTLFSRLAGVLPDLAVRRLQRALERLPGGKVRMTTPKGDTDRLAVSEPARLSLSALDVLAQEIARPIVREHLSRQLASTPAQALVDEAQDFLRHALKDPELLQEEDVEDVTKELAACLETGSLVLDEEHLDEHTRRFSRTLVRAWLETLDLSRVQGQSAIGEEDMLPLDPELRRTFFEALAPFAPDENAIESIMAELNLALFRESSDVALPLSISLTRGPQIDPDPGAPNTNVEERMVAGLRMQR